MNNLRKYGVPVAGAGMGCLLAQGLVDISPNFDLLSSLEGQHLAPVLLGFISGLIAYNLNNILASSDPHDTDYQPAHPTRRLDQITPKRIRA